jgi:hypothetical protein
MTCVIDIKSKRRLSAKVAAGLAISTVLVLGTLVAPASADEHRGGDHRGVEHRDGHGYDGHRYDGGRGNYYRAPPVVYGAPYSSPYGYPPPVVYGPGIGINIGIR